MFQLLTDSLLTFCFLLFVGYQIYRKHIPTTIWAILLTNLDHEFFLNLETGESVWEMPDEIGPVVGEIMADVEEFYELNGLNNRVDEDEEDDNDDDGGADDVDDQFPPQQDGLIHTDDNINVKKRMADVDDDVANVDSKKLKLLEPQSMTTEQKNEQFKVYRIFLLSYSSE